MGAITVIELAEKLRDLLPQEGKVFPLHEPSIGAGEKEHVMACLESTFVSSVGEYVDKFEEQLQKICEIPHAIATVNGTSALHLCLLAAGVEPAHEVLVPSMSFVATSNAVAYTGATPHFIDCEEESLGVCPDKLRGYLSGFEKDEQGYCINPTSKKVVKALVVMHTFGYIGKMDVITQICEEFGIVLLEDAAEALGSRKRGIPAGNWGLCSALSFNGNKIITTGGGGAVICKDSEVASRIRHLSTTAKLPHAWRYEHDEVGFNYRMPNLNAALGVAQLEKLQGDLLIKTNLHQKYVEALSDVGGVDLFSPEEGEGSNHWLNALILGDELVDSKEELLEVLHSKGILARPVWDPCHQLPMYRGCPSMDLPMTEKLASRIINLPSSPGLFR